MTDHADVLIVGAGASGGVAARRLAESGLKVVVLEQGHWQDPANYPGADWGWELATAGPWSSVPMVRGKPEDYPVDVSESDMSLINFNGVGGGTVLFNAIWIRLLEENFRTRTLTGLADDWPLSYQDLKPFYERTDREIGVSGLGGNPAYPPGEDPPMPPLPFGPGALEVARAISRRGWHWWPDTNAIASIPYDGRRPCVQRGACQSGCNEGAKSSIDVTHWKKAVALGAELVTGARVRRVTLDNGGLANGAEWIDADGGEHFQGADVVLVGANGIGTPRLLLNSACPAFPDGLANRSDQVGRRLMMHPLAAVIGLFREDLGSWQGHYGSTIQSLQFALSDPARDPVAGAKWALHPAVGGPVSQALAVFAAHGPGGDFHRRFDERFGHGLNWSIMCEDFPQETNRVVLSPDLVDSSGLPAPKLLYRYSEESRASLDFNVARAAEVMTEAGAWKVQVRNPAGRNAHFMGTARMGDDPATSVVDRWQMAHDIPNLGIIDGSVFVTSSSVNPTSTIVALALRAAERLIDNRAAIPVPQRRTVFAPAPAPAKAPPAAAPAPLTPEERARLKTLAGLAIPGADGMPGGDEVDGEGRDLDRVLGARPDLIVAVRTALASPDAEALSSAELQTVIASVYYLDEGVRRRIGYAGQEPRPVRPESYPAYVAEGLLDHLVTA